MYLYMNTFICKNFVHQMFMILYSCNVDIKIKVNFVIICTCKKKPCKLLELAFGPFIRYLCYKIWLNHLLTGACNSVSDNYNVIFIFY